MQIIAPPGSCKVDRLVDVTTFIKNMPQITSNQVDLNLMDRTLDYRFTPPVVYKILEELEKLSGEKSLTIKTSIIVPDDMLLNELFNEHYADKHSSRLVDTSKLKARLRKNLIQIIIILGEPNYENKEEVKEIRRITL